MEQFKLVMLPTKKASELYIANTGQLELGFNIQRDLPDVSQHIYITEPNATIEEGDWVLITNGKRTELHKSAYKDTIGWVMLGDYKFDQTFSYYKVICSTDPELGLPLCNDDFIQAVVAYDKDLVITNVQVNKHNNTCDISWFYTHKRSFEKIDLSSELVKPVQENKEQEALHTTPLPKTQQEFIGLLNTQVEGWVFTGFNPFTETNAKNDRLYLALRKMALQLFGDEDSFYELQDLWYYIKPYNYRNLPVNKSKKGWSVCGIDTLYGNSGVLEWCYSYEDAKERFEIMAQYKQFTDLIICRISDKENKPNYETIQNDIEWVCKFALQNALDKDLGTSKIQLIKQFFNEPEIQAFINR